MRVSDRQVPVAEARNRIRAAIILAEEASDLTNEETIIILTGLLTEWVKYLKAGANE